MADGNPISRNQKKNIILSQSFFPFVSISFTLLQQSFADNNARIFVCMQENPVVLFDGVCNYCNAMVNFAIRNDKKAILKFTPLQSAAGKRLKAHYKIDPGIDSVIFIEHSNIYTYSDAAVHIAKYLRWPAKALFGLKIIPKFIRQPFYKWIAKNRYKWFGKKEECMIPTPGVKARFLDQADILF